MAITYGMSVKEFWEDDPDLFWAYRFSYFTKLKSEQETFNNNAWLQGAYFHEAITVALCNAFSKQKVEYSKKPYGTDQKEEYKSESEKLMAKLKGRVTEIQNIFKNSTTEKGKSEKVGEKTNG